MKHEQQLVTSTAYYKSFRGLFLRGRSCYRITGAHPGTTNVSVSKTGFFHGPGWWHPSPPCWGSWVCHGSWLAIKKRKKKSGSLYNSTIKKLCPQSRCGREGQMWAVLLCVNCRDIQHEKQLQRAKAKSRSWLDLTGTGTLKSSSATRCGEHSLTYGQPGGGKLELLNILPTPPEKDRKPFLQLLPGQQSARRGFWEPSQETPSVLTGLHWSKH